MCFSVRKGISVPPSLLNIYKCLQDDLGEGFKRPDHGNLEGWSRQGVLLLNAALTVRAGEANSHSDIGWHQFTEAILKYLNTHSEHLVFLLWGSFAQKRGALIDKVCVPKSMRLTLYVEEAFGSNSFPSIPAVCSTWFPNLQTLFKSQCLPYRARTGAC